MITLPTAYQTGLANKYPAFYLVKLALLDIGTPLTRYFGSQPSGSVVVQYASASVIYDTSYIAARVFDAGGNEEQVDALGEIDHLCSVQDGGTVSAISDTNVTMLNLSRFQGTYHYDVEGQPVEIWEGFMPPSGSINVTVDMVRKFSGMVNNNNNDDTDNTRFSIPCIDRRTIDTAVLPGKKIVATEFPLCSKENLGKVIPIVFGDFFFQQGESPVYFMNDAIPTIQTDRFTLEYVVADHNLYDSGWSTLYKENDLTGFLSQSGVHQFASGRYTVRLASPYNSGSVVAAFFYFVPQYLGANSYGSIVNGLSWRNAIDMDDSNICSVPSNNRALFTFDSGQRLAGELILKEYSGLGNDMVLHIHCANRVGPPHAWVYNRILGNAPIDLGAINDDNYVKGLDWGAAWLNWNQFANWEYGVLTKSGESVDITSIYLVVAAQLNLGDKVNANPRSMRVWYPEAEHRGKTIPGHWKVIALPPVDISTSPVSSIFIATQGAMFTTAMVSGRSNGYNVGDVIQNPAYAIEWLLREKLGLTSTEIDWASFDAVGNTTNGTRKTWYLASVLGNQKDAFEHIKDICFEFHLSLIITPSGMYKLVALDSRTQDYTITSSDIVFDGIPQITVNTTPTDKVVNDIFLHYRMNYATNDTVETIYVSDIDDDGVLENNLTSDTGALRATTYTGWLNDSRSRYNVNKRFEATLNYIRETATAELSLKKFCDWWAFKRLICTATLVANVNTLTLQVGDVIKVDNDLLGTLNQNATKFIITRLTYPPVNSTPDSTIHMECEEIPDANTGLVQNESIPD